MEYKYFNLTTNEQSTYEQIGSKLDELTEQLASQDFICENDLRKFTDEFKNEMKSKDNFLKLIADKYGLSIDEIITISKGKLFFNI
jgi:hypothetical protein